MRTECPVLSLAASPTLWDQHSNRGRVGRRPRDRGRGWRRDRVLSSGGGVCNPCPSPGMVLGEVLASPGPLLGMVLGEVLASPLPGDSPGGSGIPCPPRGRSWGRRWHPLSLPGGGPGGGVGIPWSSPGGVVLGEALTSPGPPPGVVSASPGAGTHKKRRRKPACRPRAPARDRAALRGAISSSPPPLKPKLACGDVVWLRPG